VLVQNFEMDPLEVPRYCFVSVAGNFFISSGTNSKTDT